MPRRPAGPATQRRDDVVVAVDSIRRLVRGLRLAEQRTHAEAGLSAAQLFVLVRLAEASAASISELAERTLTDRTSVGAVVERLEAAGLARRDRDDDDRRKVLVRITPKGARVLASAPAAPTELLIRALARLNPAEVRALSRSLGRLVSEMGFGQVVPGMLFEDQAVNAKVHP